MRNGFDSLTNQELVTTCANPVQLHGLEYSELVELAEAAGRRIQDISTQIGEMRAYEYLRQYRATDMEGRCP